eukprot:TRINITY_DN1751_c0_g1_i2.p1 TRINITY_DN1751_c0_g1~~TRINITY_DN1751_c0_g1_i2.p1  ORF type:complete len:407 (-),score=97.79 TRINITY_DN1751_c0_g1_i2:25-1245(-)
MVKNTQRRASSEPAPVAAKSSAASAAAAGEIASVSSLFAQSVASEGSSAAGQGLADRFSKLFAGGDLKPPSIVAAAKQAGKKNPPSPEQLTPAAGSKQRLSEEDTTATPSTPSQASKKRRLTPEELKEREARTLFVGNVPVKWDAKKLRRTLRDAVGDKYTGQFKPMWFRAIPLEGKWNWSDKMRKAGSIQKAYTDDADSKNAYVVLSSAADVPVVSKAVNNTQADKSHQLRADGVGEAAVMKKFDRKRSVFLGNLPFSVTEADVRKAMAPAGTVDAVRLVRDKGTKECKGFAFVRFSERWSVKEALNMWGTEVQGRQIRVMKVEDSDAEKRSDKPEASSDPNHPAARRMQLRQQRRQRRKATKQKEFAKAARDAGLRTGRSKGKTGKKRFGKGGKRGKSKNSSNK